MPEYYRAVFTIEKTNMKGLSLLDDVWMYVRRWAGEEFGAPYDGLQDRGEWESRNGTLRLYNRKLDELGLSGLIWNREAEDNSDSHWRLSLRFSTDGSNVESDIEVRGVEMGTSQSGETFLAKPPSFLKTLVEQFKCTMGKEMLQAKATRIGLDQADSFTQNDVLNANRLMPIIVVSTNRHGARIVDADQLQMQVLGLARVFIYDHDTAWYIAKNLPYSLRCYDGAIRLYSPGCSLQDISQQNPYWMPADVENLRGAVWLFLRNECINRTHKHGQYRLFSHVRDQMNQIENNRLEMEVRRLEQAKEGDQENWSATLDLLIDLEDDSQDDAHSAIHRKYKVLLSIARRQQGMIQWLNEDNRRLREEILKPSSDTSNLDTENQVYTISEPSFSSIIGAVEHGSENLNGLRFLENAFKTAESRYTRNLDIHAEEFYRVLEILDECASERSNGSLGMDVKNWLAAKGIDYAPHEGEKTMEQYGNQRTFYDKAYEQLMVMQPHVKLELGGGSNQNTMRIHLVWGKDTRIGEDKWLIGYIGRHLPTISDPT